MGGARARARRHPRLLSLFEHARRRDGAGAIVDPRHRPISRARSSRSPAARIDKSWLLLQALALPLRPRSQEASDARSTARRRCLSQKALQGENDATLTFWNFCAELEGKGFQARHRGGRRHARPRREGAVSRSSAMSSTRAGRRATGTPSAASSRRRCEAKEILAASDERMAAARAAHRHNRQRHAGDLPAALSSRASPPPHRRGSRRRQDALSGAGRHRRRRTGRPGQASSTPARSIGRAGGMSSMLRILSRSRLLIAAWSIGSQFAGARLLPSTRKLWRLRSWPRRIRARCSLNLARPSARVAAAFAIAMTLGTVAGLADGALAHRPTASAIPGSWCCSTCRRW